MNLSDIDILSRIVKPLAKEVLLPEFGIAKYEYKEDGSVITQADHDMQKELVNALNVHWPEYKVLGEEMSDHEQQDIIDNEKSYWCVDPVDGTSNFAKGLPFFAVSIAFIKNQQSELGFIYDPVRDELFHAIKGQGAYLNSECLTCNTEATNNKNVMAEIDFKRLPKDIAHKLIEEEPFASQRNIGSSAIDWCWLAAGRYDIYLHGGQKLWDYAAGHLICSEAGGTSISLDGQPVFRGELEIRSVLASLDSALLGQWITWLKIPEI